MENVIAFMGSPRVGKNTDMIVDKLIEGNNEIGIKTEKIILKDYKINGCQGCYSCIKTGKCVVLDDMENIHMKIKKAKGLIFASPSYNYNITSQMKALIDRLFCYYDFGGNSWTSRLGNSKKALVIGICAGPDDNSMGYTIEAMVKPLIDLNINIIKKLTYYNTAKNPIVNNEEYQIKLIEIGKEFGLSINSN
ncbi:flavodoxin family protein [Clostridium sp. Cult1]|uniref:flavodoxin family protein n=1 Tax=Clostridium sp. Cult1 TaxID=2079002 RepID=UPI001F205A5F|nr:flavodoxin family protein [Clostridium sp. Cult1]MCF6463598.1 flavin reductase [Clostridium sp. Cult1]